MDYSQFLTPAIATGLFIYLVNFFGKIMSDQMPVVDDRKWHIQINGIMFMTNMLMGLLGIYLALNFPWGLNHWWIHLITFLVFMFVYASLYSHGLVEGSKIYKHRTKELIEANKKNKEARAILLWVGKHLETRPLSVILFYFGTLEYLSGNIYWMIVTPVVMLLMFVQSAYNSSLKPWKDAVPVTIYFIDKEKDPLKKVTILKEKEDSYRIRVDDTIMLLNKNEVSKVEMVIPEHLR